jgi:hypothetical protein
MEVGGEEEFTTEGIETTENEHRNDARILCGLFTLCNKSFFSVLSVSSVVNLLPRA